ncbi:MAG: zf-HC2 domain-containing protein, partial [Candidatus Polarisedimenticolia bacterium]
MNAARNGFAGGGCGAARGLLHALWDGEIGDADRRALDAHLARCAECRAFAERGGALRAGLAALPDPALPDDALDAVFAATVDRRRPEETRDAAARERRGMRAQARRRVRPRIAIAIACCAATLVVALVAADGRRAAERERIRRAE